MNVFRPFLFFASLCAACGSTPEGLLGPTTGTNELSAIVYGGDRFVAVGGHLEDINSTDFSEPLVMTSRDGTAWTYAPLPAEGWGRDIAYGNGLFVAVVSELRIGTGGESLETSAIFTSPDGETWTKQEAPAVRYHSIVFGEGRFVAAADSNDKVFIVTSQDGVTWSQQELSPAWWSPRLSYGKDLFLLYGEGKVLATSPDGVAWNDFFEVPVTKLGYVGEIAGELAGVGFFDCCFGEAPDGITTVTLRSAQGVEWSAASGEGAHINELAIGQTRAIAATGQKIFETNRLDASSIFRDLRANDELDGDFTAVAYGTGTFIAVGSAIDGDTRRIQIARLVE